ncbi:RDD family protein [Amycolatopsis sp. cg5]|uniref:RDD family protein n=1 Tax=Amycolatopsis sp. cg5 TaxID=3238802 RepID=UPI0035247493
MTAPTVRRKYELSTVRVRDLRNPVAATGPLPATHGDDNDPRYPSPKVLRNVLAVLTDLVLHLGIGVAVGLVAKQRLPGSPWVLYAILAFVAASIVHRIFLQRLFGATLGKALTGLRLIRDDNAGRPNLWALTRFWLLSLLTALYAINP